jgi:hypothetical protein
MCAFKSYPLKVPDSQDEGRRAADGTLEAAAASPDPFADALRASLETIDPTETIAQRKASLVLSGGSLNGAYGAGFLDTWRQESPGQALPAFASVTGISTGAILSTFAFTGRTEPAVQGYSITRETQLLKPNVTFKNGAPTTTGYIAVLRKGALGDLAPLRIRLHEVITDAILSEVAAGARARRSLFVGVVDADSGEAQAFDMTDMATRFDAAAPVDKARWRDCYVEAIVASSSAPLAAAPVFIDNRMLIDGGARFGMFTAALASANKAYLKAGPRRMKPITFVIINGTQRIGTDCGKADPQLCIDHPPDGGVEGVHRPWNFATLALRSEGILANQVYRFSEAFLAGDAGDYRVTRIEPSADTHEYQLDDPVLGQGRMSCADWRALDRRIDNPVQFSPRYMRCLIDYGRARARHQAGWKAMQAR